MILKKEEGFTFLEIIVSISLIIVLAFIIDILLIDRILQKKTNYRALAHQIAQEELEVLKSYPFTKLSTTTDGAFIGILYHKGVIEVATNTSAVSGTQILDVTSAPVTATTTAQVVLPKNSYGDATISAQLKFFDDSGSPFGGGIFFRSLDENNGYLLKLSSTNDLTLDLHENGTVTNLVNQIYTVMQNTWYDINLILAGDNISLEIEGLPIFSTTDSTFTEGFAAIVATDEAHIGIDDIAVTEGSTTVWNFDNEALGNLEGIWSRPGLTDLPSSSAKLTIKNYTDSGTLKEITVRVEWFDNDTITAVEESTLINSL